MVEPSSTALRSFNLGNFGDSRSSHQAMKFASLVAAIASVGFAFGASVLSGAEKPADPVIELPKFVVTDSRELPEPESWRYAAIPGVEILSNASDRTTQRLIRDFEMFRDALNVVWRMPDQTNTPILLILCGRGGKFDAFVPAKAEGGPEVTRASVFLKGKERTAIVVDVEATVLNVLSVDADDPATGVNSTQFAVEHNKQLYREYVRYMMSKSVPRLPVWFEEGMAQIVMAMKFDKKFIEFGKLEDPNTVSAQAAMVASSNAAATAEDPDAAVLPGAPAEDRDFNAALAQRALLPWDQFFAVTYDSPEAMNPLGNNRWAKQAYAFVHMGLYGEGGIWQKPFTQFLMRATREPVTEALMKDCFKMTYKQLGLQMRGYIQVTNYTSKEYRIKGAGMPEPSPLALRDATQSEVGRIKGQAFLLGGKKAAARAELIAPYTRGERDPQLLAALGLLEKSDDREDRARKFLTAAVAADTADADAYLELARFKFDDAVKSAGAPDIPFPADQRAEITRLLLKARSLPPQNPAVYELLADTWVHSPTPPQRDDLVPLVQGVQLFPARLRMVYETATLCADAKIYDAAHSLAEHGVKSAPDAATKAKFEQFRATLPPLPAAPAAAPHSAPAAKK